MEKVTLSKYAWAELGKVDFAVDLGVLLVDNLLLLLFVEAKMGNFFVVGCFARTPDSFELGNCGTWHRC